MKAKCVIAVVVLLPFALLGTACQGSPDPRMRHARESDEWQAWDANLDRLHRARRSVREPVLLPPQPSLGNATRTAAWTLALASERHRLASMSYQETLNDLDHCKQAVSLAQKQVETASVGHTTAAEDLGRAVRNFMQAFKRSKLEHKRQILERFLAAMPETYRHTIRSLVEQR